MALLNQGMNMSRVGILPARELERARCPFHKTLQIIPLLSKAEFNSLIFYRLESLGKIPWPLATLPGTADS
ncbi:MAG: hypothetical protein F6K55_00715 [Moorea sp. SIO4A3]|nr:hypothetical protein [Moorena sp. SIO4A3]